MTVTIVKALSLTKATKSSWPKRIYGLSKLFSNYFYVMRLIEAGHNRYDDVYGLNWPCMLIMAVIYGGFLAREQVGNGGRRFSQRNNEEEQLALLDQESSAETRGFLWRLDVEAKSRMACMQATVIDVVM